MNKKEALKESYDAIQGSMDYEIKNITLHMEALRKAKTLKTFMLAKKKLLLSISDALPLFGGACPYCNLFSDGGIRSSLACHGCGYGEKYGICGHTNSVYSKIVDAQSKLCATIHKYWMED